jgi:hypothetical protein
LRLEREKIGHMPMQSAELCTLIFVCPAKTSMLKVPTVIFWWALFLFSLGSKNSTICIEYVD